MKFNARIPMIPLPYKDKELAVEKEILIDYGDGVEFPNIYVVDEYRESKYPTIEDYNKNKYINITQGIINALHGSPGDNFTIIISPDKDHPESYQVNLGDFLNLLYTISLTHDGTMPLEEFLERATKEFDDDGNRIGYKSTTIVDKNGIVYAPRTLSSAVFTEEGTPLDEKLNAISQVAVKVEITPPAEEDTNLITIPYPDSRYASYPDEYKTFLLYVGSVLVDPDRYRIEGTNLIFNDEDDYIEAGRSAVFVFIYNSMTPETGALLVMDGKYITPYTIQTNRLAETSDSIDLNTNDTIATSRAVCTLRNVLNSRIDELAGNVSVTVLADPSSTSDKIVVKIPNYILKDSNMIHIRLREDLAPNATLQVNDAEALPIYNGNTTDTEGPVAGEIINVSFNSLENVFYIYGISKFKLETTVQTVSPDPGTSIIPFTLFYDKLIDKLDVYYNGIKMFEDINYVMGQSFIELLDFVSEAGDLFTFELTQIVPVKK